MRPLAHPTREGSCLAWPGPFDHEKPMVMDEHGARAARPQVWALHYGVDILKEIRPPRIQTLCHRKDCVEPTHACVQGPKETYKAHGMDWEDARDLRGLIMTKGQAGSLQGGWWDMKRIHILAAHRLGAGLKGFGMPQETVTWIAEDLKISKVVVLVTWADIIKREGKK